ncbi:ribonuclease T2 family protein [Ralstonia pseudosolanacearum]|uniref:ribonuclease T2 family protein n=1 Tax=Ralstonia pseudosolanacearum TaxID=1310165 RepID=UPI003CEB36F4
MREQLAKAWPDVYNFGVSNPSASYFTFWAHEWRQHGCFTGRTPAAYFQTSLNLYTEMGLLRQQLSSAQCRPGLPCNLGALLSALDTRYPNMLPRIVFTKNRAGNTQIQEVRFGASANGEIDPLGGVRTQ